MDSSRIDVFVASGSFDVDVSALPNRCGFAYFIDSSDIDTVRDQRAISKFQKADLIYKQILSVYSEKAGNEKQIAEIFSHIYYYWNRDKSSRIDSVHFFIDQDQVYRDDQLNHFAINVGGEILRWSL